MLARLKPSPFKATIRAGRSCLHYLVGRTRASAPTWTVQMSRRIRVCASMLAGGTRRPPQLQPHSFQ